MANYHSDEQIMNKYIQQRINAYYKFACHRYSSKCILGVFARGSMNYGLTYAHSDVDARCIVIPIDLSIQTINYIEYMPPNGEHLEFIDIYSYCDQLMTQQLSDVEILFTQYCCINSQYQQLWDKFIQYRNIIATYQPELLLQNLTIAIQKKYNSLKTRYPNIIHILNHFGYNPKQLYHILRFCEFGEKYMKSKPYEKCLRSSKRNRLLQIKSMSLPMPSEEEAFQLANNTIIKFQQQVQLYKKQHINDIPNNKIPEFFAHIKQEINKLIYN